MRKQFNRKKVVRADRLQGIWYKARSCFQKAVMQDDRLALLNPLQGGLTPAAVTAGCGVWDPSSPGSSPPPQPREQLPSPSGSSCPPAPAAGMQDPWQSCTGQLLLPAQSWAAPAGLLLQQQLLTLTHSLTCCPLHRSWQHMALAARQDVSHLWPHSPLAKAKCSSQSIQKATAIAVSHKVPFEQFHTSCGY